MLCSMQAGEGPEVELEHIQLWHEGPALHVSITSIRNRGSSTEDGWSHVPTNTMTRL